MFFQSRMKLATSMKGHNSFICGQIQFHFHVRPSNWPNNSLKLGGDFMFTLASILPTPPQKKFYVYLMKRQDCKT